MPFEYKLCIIKYNDVIVILSITLPKQVCMDSENLRAQCILCKYRLSIQIFMNMISSNLDFKIFYYTGSPSFNEQSKSHMNSNTIHAHFNLYITNSSNLIFMILFLHAKKPKQSLEPLFKCL